MLTSMITSILTPGKESFLYSSSHKFAWWMMQGASDFSFVMLELEHPYSLFHYRYPTYKKDPYLYQTSQMPYWQR